VALACWLIPAVASAQACLDAPALTTDPTTIAVSDLDQAPGSLSTVVVFLDGGTPGAPVASATIPGSAWTPDPVAADCYVAPVPATWASLGAGPYRAAMRFGTVWSDPSNLVAWTVVAPPPPPPPPPPPAPGVTSPDCTSGQSIIDATGGIWTIVSTQIQRDGVWVQGYQGSEYLWANSTVYILNLNGNWYSWSGSSWVFLGPMKPACATPPPPPPPPDPVPPPVPVPPPSWTCTVPSAVSTYANGDKKITVRCPPSTAVVKGDSVKVSK
jgi:hypothetical protein